MSNKNGLNLFKNMNDAIIHQKTQASIQKAWIFILV